MPVTLDAEVLDAGADGAVEGDASMPDAGPPALPDDVHSLDGMGAEGSDAAYAPLDAMVRDARVVALGAGTATSGGYEALRARAFRYLVEQHGFRALAVDARWDNWLSITPALCEGDDPRVALRGDEEGLYASEEFAETARFLCSWNDAHPGDRITLFAFRGMTPWRDAPALRSLLAELAGDDRASLEAGIATCSGATSTREELLASYPIAMTRAGHDACLAGLDSLDAWIDAHEDAIRTARGETELRYASLRSRSLRASEQYFWTTDARTATGNAPDVVASVTARFEHEWEAFEAHRAIHAPDARLVVFSADTSIVRRGEELGLPRPVSIGCQLHRELGAEYVPIIGLTHQEVVDWPSAGVVGELAAFDGPRSVERRLHELQRPLLVVDFHDETASRRFLEPGELVTWFTTTTFDITTQAEGALFVDRSEAFESLVW